MSAVTSIRFEIGIFDGHTRSVAVVEADRECGIRFGVGEAGCDYAATDLLDVAQARALVHALEAALGVVDG